MVPNRKPPDRPDRLIYGLHPVAEILESRPGRVERIFALRNRAGALGRAVRTGRLAGVPVTYLSRELLTRKTGRGAVHQGIAAQVAPIAYADVDEICREAVGHKSGLLVVLDGIVDPRNLGAALRTCAAAGAAGVILGAKGTAGLTAAATKASAGAAERIAVGRDAKPSKRLAELRERGFQVVGLDVRGETSWDELDLRGPLVLVAGGEQRGLRPALIRECSTIVAIPLFAGVDSLNVAVALGVLLFEVVRQRRRPSRSGG